MRRAAIYIRVSSQEQKLHGLSVGNQQEALTKYCLENDLMIAGVYNDAGISARKKYKKRPALLRLIQDCKDGKIDLILFTKLDRWFRSVGDYYEVQTVLDDCHVPWRAIWEDYETETSAGVLKVNIMLSVAQAEADRTSERLKATFEYKREHGDYLGCPPVGYKVGENKRLVIDPEKEKGVRVFFDEYIATLSVPKAMEAAKIYGLVGTRQKFYNMIKNPAYVGETNTGYNCDPYLTQKQWDYIQQRVDSRPRLPKNPSRTYLYSGILFCGYCGHRLLSQTYYCTNKSGKRLYYKTYHCRNSYSTSEPHPHIQMSQNSIENYLLNELDKILSDKIIIVKEQNKIVNYSGAAKRKKNLETKLKRLAILFEEGDIDVASYREKRDAIKSEINSIVLEPVEEPEPLPDGWREIYEELDDKHKREFWTSIIKRIVITNETKSSPLVELL